MNYSASFYEEEDTEEEESRLFQWIDKVTKGRGEEVVSYFTVALSLIMALVLFTVLPTFIAGWFRNLGVSRLGINFMEAGIKVLFFLLYLLGISRIPEIDRVFRYHGAEHKVIAAYENNLDLTVENVRKSSRYHARCGTNFMFLVLMVSIAVYSLLPLYRSLDSGRIQSPAHPGGGRGCTFELLRWLGKSRISFIRLISAPGKMMQRITTKEPDDAMIEVAITALKRSEEYPTRCGN